MDVSIIIVSYNTKEKTHRCIESVIKNTIGISYEIIVSDNGSTDGSVEDIKKCFEEVILIENGKNVGFGRANNIALACAKGNCVFYLNSDTYLLNNSVKVLYDYWMANHASKNLGAIGGQLLDSDFQYTHSGAEFPTYSTFCKAELKSIVLCLIKAFFKLINKDGVYLNCIKNKNSTQQLQTGYIGYITGADLFVKNDELAKFNEEYFMYCEETELELNMSKMNLNRIIIEGTQIVHDQARTHGKEINVYKVTDYFKEQSSIIYCKNNLRKNPLVLKLLIKINGINPYVRRVRKNAN